MAIGHTSEFVVIVRPYDFVSGLLESKVDTAYSAKKTTYAHITFSA